MSADVGSVLAPPLFGSLEKQLQRVTGLVATLEVVGMLVAASATVVDIVLRAVAGGGVIALNEIVSMAFAVSIAACIPAGLAGGVNLKIDILSRWMSNGLIAWLDAFGAVVLLIFFALLTQQIAIFAGTLASQNRRTVILGLAAGPVYGRSRRIVGNRHGDVDGSFRSACCISNTS